MRHLDLNKAVGKAWLPHPALCCSAAAPPASSFLGTPIPLTLQNERQNNSKSRAFKKINRNPASWRALDGPQQSLFMWGMGRTFSGGFLSATKGCLYWKLKGGIPETTGKSILVEPGSSPHPWAVGRKLWSKGRRMVGVSGTTPGLIWGVLTPFTQLEPPGICPRVPKQ